MGVLSTREDILIYSLAYRCCGNGRNTGQTRLHLQRGGNREFGFPCVCLFVCSAVCRSHMVKKHCCDEKGMGPKLYPDKHAFLSCKSKTVIHAVIFTAHSPRNTSTHTCPLFPPHIRTPLELRVPRLRSHCPKKTDFLFHRYKPQALSSRVLKCN